MNQMKCIIADLNQPNNIRELIVCVDDEGDEICIETKLDEKNIKVSQEYYLQTYQVFRDMLLELGYGLKCNGSRRNAIQSGMMGFSEKIYLVELGEQALKKDIADIWEYADIDSFPNTEEQDDFAQQWIASVKK